MKRFLNLFVQDLKISVRNALILFLVAVMVVMVVVVAFVIPDEPPQEGELLVADLTQGEFYAEAIRQEGEPVIFFQDKTSLLAALEENPNTMALLIEGQPGEPEVTAYHHGLLNHYSEALLTQFLTKEFTDPQAMALYGEADAIHMLRGAQAAPEGRKAYVPFFLALDVAMMGFMMGAVLMLEERGDGTLRALRVTPVGTATYILSKSLVFLLVSLVYAALLMLVMGTWPINPLAFWSLLIAGSLLFTFLGMILATFFKTMSEWLFAGMAVLVAGMLPIVSFLAPSFQPRWMGWIPTTWMLDGFNELLFPVGRSVTQWVLMTIGVTLVVYAACHVAIRQRLMKEGVS
jgi:ABC-2 type transport system permease protein/fluoroquinolone transport system permease protein